MHLWHLTWTTDNHSCHISWDTFLSKASGLIHLQFSAKMSHPPPKKNNYYTSWLALPSKKAHPLRTTTKRNQQSTQWPASSSPDLLITQIEVTNKTPKEVTNGKTNGSFFFAKIIHPDPSQPWLLSFPCLVSSFLPFDRFATSGGWCLYT